MRTWIDVGVVKAAPIFFVRRSKMLTDKDKKPVDDEEEIDATEEDIQNIKDSIIIS